MQIVERKAAPWQMRQQANAPCDAKAAYIQGLSAMQPALLDLLSPAGIALEISSLDPRRIVIGHSAAAAMSLVT